jgi:hypothetical protein
MNDDEYDDMPLDCTGHPIRIGDLCRWRLADRVNRDSGSRMIVTWLGDGCVRVLSEAGAETLLWKEVVVVQQS